MAGWDKARHRQRPALSRATSNAGARGVQDVARTLRVAVIGAGIGGLAAASALHRMGIEVEVLERAVRQRVFQDRLTSMQN